MQRPKLIEALDLTPTANRGIDNPRAKLDNICVLQLSFKKASAGRAKPAARERLSDLCEGEQAVIEHLDLPEDFARRLMELGFLPGSRITAGRGAPGGDPRVFRVDGCDVALRQETASRLLLRL